MSARKTSRIGALAALLAATFALLAVGCSEQTPTPQPAPQQHVGMPAMQPAR